MTEQIKYRCKDIVFHFNKKHLEDPTVPMWVIKSHGVTFYVNHVSAEVPWTTKETPDNAHTKGAIKFKNCTLTIDENNDATIGKVRIIDRLLPHPRVVHARIIAPVYGDFHDALDDKEFKHSKIKTIEGACSSEFIVCDLLDKDEVILAGLKYAGKFRIMVPNETYYQAYDKSSEYIAVDYSQENTLYEYT